VSTSSKSAAVYEAVIRFQIKSWNLSADSFCIKINGRDADKYFLEQLELERVQQASACKETGKSLGYMSVVDKKTNKDSVIFDLENIRWNGESEADIDGGWLCGSMCMARGVYHAVQDQSGWHVIRFDAHVAS
jgi:hypothetical protein